MADSGRREKERKSRDGGGSGAIYRREESWARGAASGKGRTILGRLGGELAERAGGELHGGAAWRLGSAPRTRVSVGRCQGAGQVALEGFPGPLGRGRAVDEVHRRRTAGGGRNRAAERREMEVRAYLRFLKVQGPLGKLKISPS